MRTDFFDDLGENLTRTAREFGERAESLYETQRLRGKILSEEHAVNKLMTELGRTLYRSYTKGAELTEEQTALCEKIVQHKETIERCKGEMTGKKGKKICPSCKESVDKTVSFCPYCGASCPDTMEKEATDDIAEESAKEELVENEPEVVGEEAFAETEAPGFRGEPADEDAEAAENVSVEKECEADSTGA